MRISGAIFDLDGTLIDSMFIWFGVPEKYLQSKKIEPPKDINKTIETMSLEEIAVFFKKKFGISDDEKQIIDGFNEVVEDFYTNTVLAKPGVEEMLEHLKSLGVKMCVATAANSKLAIAALKRTGLSKYFSEVFTCGHVGVGKEDPAIFHHAHIYLKTPIEETYVFEDSLYAISTAKTAGFPVVAIYDKWQDDHQINISTIADIHVKGYHELIQILKKIKCTCE